MNLQMHEKILLPGLLSVLLVACSTDDRPPETAMADSAAPQAEASESTAPGIAAPVVAEEKTTAEEVVNLGNTSWQLVQIMSMDDSTDVPADPTLYTLDFGADGMISIQADCNRGTGSWKSEAEGQLQFGPLATTRAMCPPGSLFDAYVAQFQWVRSYVIRDGHLFLATMADGSIIEFKPAG